MKIHTNYQRSCPQSGFTLVELIVSIMIISVLANIAMSRVHDYTAKAKCTEAVVTLGSYERFQTSFAEEYDRVGSLSEIGLEVTDGNWFSYGYLIGNVTWINGGGVQTAAGQGKGTSKASVCHVPPGNPSNAHTISVGNPAWATHVAHGDASGECPNGSTEQTAILVANTRNHIIWDCKVGNGVFTEWASGEVTRGNANGGNCGKYMGSWFKR